MTESTTSSTTLSDGIALAKSGKREEARQLFYQAISNNEGTSIAWCWLSSMSPDPQESLTFIQYALETDPENAFAKDTYIRLSLKIGIEAGRQQKKAIARKHFDNVLQLSPDHELALVWKAGLADSPEEGIELLERVLKINPQNSRAREGLEQFRKQIAMRAGCPLCQATLSQGSDSRTCPKCRAVITLADADAFRTPPAVDTALLKRVAQELHSRAKTQSDPQTVFRLGLCYLNLGFFREASRTFQAYLRLNPNDRDIRQQVDKLSNLFVQRTESPTPSHSASPSRASILVVDDSPTIQKLVSATLMGIGYDVQTVSRAEDAITLLRQGTIPQLFLLDVNMPGMDGFQLCKALRQIPETRSVPVVFLTGKDGLLNKLKGQWVGASEYLTKPFDPKLLVNTVKKVLSKGTVRG